MYGMIIPSTKNVWHCCQQPLLKRFKKPGVKSAPSKLS